MTDQTNPTDAIEANLVANLKTRNEQLSNDAQKALMAYDALRRRMLQETSVAHALIRALMLTAGTHTVVLGPAIINEARTNFVLDVKVKYPDDVKLAEGVMPERVTLKLVEKKSEGQTDTSDQIPVEDERGEGKEL